MSNTKPLTNIIKIKNLFVLGFVSIISMSVFSQENKTYYSLEEALKNPTEVYSLHLSKFPFFEPDKETKLSVDIGKLINLTALYIERNNLVSLPESIGNLKNLEYLTVGHNKLKKLPESIGNLKKLYHLNVEENDLESLPNSIGNLTSLENLYLANNNLKVLPETLMNLNKLYKLDLRYNALTTFPTSTKSQLKAFNNLTLYGNKIEILPESFFNINLSLLTISFADEGIENLMKNVKKLNLINQLHLNGDFLTEEEKERLKAVQPYCDMRL